MISANKYRKMISGDRTAIERGLRVLPDFISQEHKNPQVATPKVLKNLEKHLKVAREEFAKLGVA
tara:strand:- start:209 stop:403 length:195 start_codon:yes stop_codon:yes gene_type:complete